MIHPPHQVLIKFCLLCLLLGLLPLLSLVVGREEEQVSSVVGREEQQVSSVVAREEEVRVVAATAAVAARAPARSGRGGVLDRVSRRLSA